MRAKSSKDDFANTREIDRPIFSLVHKKRVTGDIGIENELEGIGPAGEIMPLNNSKFWTDKVDDSLRSGTEFVLVKPVSIFHLSEAIEEFFRIIRNYNPRTSIRTSTHIHVNVQTKTVREVYNIIIAYYLIEELLIMTQPKERIGNLFCLRMKDSNAIFQFLKQSLVPEYEYFFSFFREENHKYSALNLCPVLQLGSLEFRFLAAILSEKEMLRWSVLFYELVSVASKIDMTKLLDLYDTIPVKQFLRQLLPSSPWVYEGYTSGALNELLHTNYDSLRELARYYSKHHGNYHPAPNYWDDDEEEKVAGNQYYALDDLASMVTAEPTVDEITEW